MSVSNAQLRASYIVFVSWLPFCYIKTNQWPSTLHTWLYCSLMSSEITVRGQLSPIFFRCDSKALICLSILSDCWRLRLTTSLQFTVFSNQKFLLFFGWGRWIWTSVQQLLTCRSQSPVPYLLATSQYSLLVYFRVASVCPQSSVRPLC